MLGTMYKGREACHPNMAVLKNWQPTTVFACEPNYSQRQLLELLHRWQTNLLQAVLTSYIIQSTKKLRASGQKGL